MSSVSAYEAWKQQFLAVTVPSVEWTLSRAGFRHNPLSKVTEYRHLGGSYPVNDWHRVRNVKALNPNLGFIVAVWNHPQKYLIATACIFGKSKTKGITSAHALVNDQGQYPDALQFWSAPNRQWIVDTDPFDVELTQKNKKRLSQFARKHRYHGDGYYRVHEEYTKQRGRLRFKIQERGSKERWDIGLFGLKTPVFEATKSVTFANVERWRPQNVGIHGYPLSDSYQYPSTMYGAFGRLLVPSNRSWDREWESGATTIRAWRGMSGSPMFVANNDNEGYYRDGNRLVIVGIFFGTNITERDGDWLHSEYSSTLICDGAARFLNAECGDEFEWASLDMADCVENENPSPSTTDVPNESGDNVQAVVRRLHRNLIARPNDRRFSSLIHLADNIIDEGIDRITATVSGREL